MVPPALGRAALATPDTLPIWDWIPDVTPARYPISAAVTDPMDVVPGSAMVPVMTGALRVLFDSVWIPARVTVFALMMSRHAVPSS